MNPISIKRNAFESVVISMIGIYGDVMEDAVMTMHSVGYLSYVQNFRTIRLETPRQTGTTEAVKHLATKDDIIICRSTKIKDRYQKYNLDRLNVQSVNQSNRPRGNAPAKILWIDDIHNDQSFQELIKNLWEDCQIDYKTLVFVVR